MVRPLRATLRMAGVLVGCAATVAGAWRLAGGPLADLVGPVSDGGPGAVAALPLEVVVAGLCGAALLGCALWLLVTTMLVLAAYGARLADPGRPLTAAIARAVDRAAARACPRSLHRAVAACLGVAVATGVAWPALADPARTPDVTGLALPDRAIGAAPSSTAAPPCRHPVASTVVVRPGDSLWSIAAGLLPAGAPDREVSAAWHRLHRTNLARIGTDPDLILPGTRLVVPAPDSPHRKDTP